jgi:hypothetical protein
MFAQALALGVFAKQLPGFFSIWHRLQENNLDSEGEGKTNTTE